MSTLEFQTRLLVVDDDPAILQLMTAILEAEGFVVRTADDGFAALNFLRRTQPDLIISDLRMPNMSGFELLSIVRRRYPHIPVIALSGEYVLEGMPARLIVDAFFQKGDYTPPQLSETIRRLLVDGPIRPHLGKVDKAPLWIPRRDADYIVVTCTECLRSFPEQDTSTGTEIHESECPSCGTMVRYLVDSAVLQMLQERRRRSFG
jgi:CheY-like chemotaxis protein